MYRSGTGQQPIRGAATARPRRGWLGPRARLLLAGFAGATVFAALSGGGRFTRVVPPVWQELDRLAIHLGLEIGEIRLTGHRQTSDSEVYGAIAELARGSMLSFNPVAARARVEALPWIAEASVARELPNRIVIEVRERVPYAIWRTGDGLRLVDQGGHELASVDEAEAAGLSLPRIAGDGAPRRAKSIHDEIAAYPELAARLATAEYVARRRWTLHMAGGTAVHLPAEGIGDALARLSDLHARGQILDRSLAALDLRAGHRLFVEPRPTGVRRAAG